MKRFKKFVLMCLYYVLPERAILRFLQRVPFWPRPVADQDGLDAFYADQPFNDWNTDGLLGTLSADDVEELIKDLPQHTPISVLDVGCGRGAVSIAVGLARPMAHVTGIDIVFALVNQAVANPMCPDNVTFKVMPAENLAFPDASFDRVICVDVLCHLRQKSSAFQELVRVLKPGGKLLMLDWVGTRLTPPNLAALSRCPYFWTSAHYDQALVPLGFCRSSDSARFKLNLHRWIAKAGQRTNQRGTHRKLALVFMRYVLWCLDTDRLDHAWVVGEKLPRVASTSMKMAAG